MVESSIESTEKKRASLTLSWGNEDCTGILLTV